MTRRETEQENWKEHLSDSATRQPVSSKTFWRVFCAVELPESLRRTVTQRITRLKEAVPDAQASWSRDTNLHLTLKFLGEVPQNSIQSFSAAVSRAVAGFPPFPLMLEQTGVFPHHGSPRVLWIGINDLEGRLGSLHSRLEEEAASAGFEKDTRSFHPHLTLARLRNPKHARTLGSVHKQLAFGPTEIMVSELLVIRSELSSKGSKYTVISRHALSATSANPQP